VSGLQKIFWSSLLIKLAVAAFLPLTNDEAYYWVWSQHMQLSYYDHPPIVAWLFWLGDQLDVGLSSVRWPGVLLGHGTLGLWLLILRPILTDQQRVYWLLLALLSPLVGGTNLVVTPDLPLLFFNALALFVFFQWKDKGGWWRAFLLGLSVGLGFSSKYVMALFPLSLLPLVFMSAPMRAMFLRHFVWLLLGFALGTIPVWLWNVLHDFVSIRFQLEHGLGRPAWKPRWSIEYVWVQIGLIFPVILWAALKARRADMRLFHFMAWVPLAFFFVTTSRGYVEANWPIVAYPAIFVLAVSHLPARLTQLRVTLATWSVFLSALAFVILVQPAWSKAMKFREFHQYDAVLDTVRDVHPLYARSYQMAARLQYELRRPIYKLRGMNRVDFYDFLEQSEPKEPMFYLLAEKRDLLPESFRERGFKIVERREVESGFELLTVQAP